MVKNRPEVRRYSSRIYMIVPIKLSSSTLLELEGNVGHVGCLFSVPSDIMYSLEPSAANLWSVSFGTVGTKTVCVCVVSACVHVLAIIMLTDILFKCNHIMRLPKGYSSRHFEKWKQNSCCVSVCGST